MFILDYSGSPIYRDVKRAQRFFVEIWVGLFEPKTKSSERIFCGL